MNRLWFAIIFSIICAGLCVGEQCYVKEVYSRINEELSKSEQYENYEDLVNSIKNIQDYWDNKSAILFMVSNHGNLDDIETVIRQLDSNDENIKSALAEAKALNTTYYKNERLNLRNIL